MRLALVYCKWKFLKILPLATVFLLSAKIDFGVAAKTRPPASTDKSLIPKNQRIALNPGLFVSGSWSLKILSNKHLAVTRSILGSVVFKNGKTELKALDSSPNIPLNPAKPFVYCEFGSNNEVALLNPKGVYEIVQIQDGKEENLNLVDIGLLRRSDHLFLALSCRKNSGGYFRIDEIADSLGTYASLTEKKEELKLSSEDILGLPKEPTEILQLLHSAESNVFLFTSKSYRFGMSLESAVLRDVNPINEISFPGLFYLDLFAGRFLQNGRPKTFSDLDKSKAFCVSFAKAKIMTMDTALNYRIRVIESKANQIENLWVTTTYWHPLTPQPISTGEDSLDLNGMIHDGTLHIACVSSKPLLWKEMKEISGLPLEFKVKSYADFLEENPQPEPNPSEEVPEGFFKDNP